MFYPEPVVVLLGVFMRLFSLILHIKIAATYSRVVGKDLGIIGAHRMADAVVANFTVSTETSITIEWVKLSFTQYTQGGVVVGGRLNECEWGLLGIVVTKPWHDEHALLDDTSHEDRTMRFTAAQHIL